MNMAVSLVLLAVLSILVALYCVWLVLLRGRGLPRPPSPPVVTGFLPFIGCGLDFVRSPRDFLQECRRKHGDTFILHLFGAKLFCVFSSPGLRALYSVRENDASFTEATKGLLGLKLPKELITGSMLMFHKGLRKKLLEGYLRVMDELSRKALLSLGDSGELEVFSFMKQLVHRVGVTCWVGREAAEGESLQRFIKDFEALDPEKSFQSLSAIIGIYTYILTHGESREDQAFNDMVTLFTSVWMERERKEQWPEDNLQSLYELHADLPLEKRHRQVATEVFQFHVASQANMYAALAWTMCFLLVEDQQHREKIESEMKEVSAEYDGDFLHDVDALGQLKYTEAFVQEALRISQQSITLRKVMREIKFMDHTIPKGYYITTLLSITNTHTHPDDPPPNVFCPTRRALEGNEVYQVSTFGHGFHACPGQKFALSFAKIFLYNLLTGFSHLEFSPRFTNVAIPPSTVGAVARSAKPCIVAYSTAQKT